MHSGPESLRHGFNVDVSPRDLEETYLPAFRTTVVDGHVKSVMCAYNAIDGTAACANQMLLKDHLHDAWGFKGFVVSDCGAIVDVANGHHNAPDILHASALSIQAGTDLSCSIWAPGFNTLADAVRQGVVSEQLVTAAAERLFTARIQLGFFDPPGDSALDRIPFSSVASEENREDRPPRCGRIHGPVAEQRRSADRSSASRHRRRGADCRSAGFSGRQLQRAARASRESAGRHHEAISLDYDSLCPGIYPGQRCQRAGATHGVRRGLRTEFFATPDWTGRPVHVATAPEIQYDWDNAAPAPEVLTQNYSVRWSGTLRVPATGKYVFTVETGSAFPYSPRETYRFVLDGKVLAEGDLNSGKPNPKPTGAPSTAPPIMSQLERREKWRSLSPTPTRTTSTWTTATPVICPEEA